MNLKAEQEKMHRMVITVHKGNYLKLRSQLLALERRTVSDWIRETINRAVGADLESGRTELGLALFS